MKPLHVAAIAEEELHEARGWYDREGPDLGRKFVEAVDLLFSGISENSKRFPVVHHEIRRAIVQSFPYGVFFIDQPEFIKVIAVVHLHRHPRTWERRK